MKGHEHKHEGVHSPHGGSSGGRRTPPIRIKIKETPGAIHTGRHMHDGAVVISGSLTVVTNRGDFQAVIAERLENAARIIKGRGGVVGHIKASASAASMEMISVTDEDATVKQSPERTIRINLTAIVFSIEPEEAEKIIKTALTEISKRSPGGEDSAQP